MTKSVFLLSYVPLLYNDSKIVVNPDDLNKILPDTEPSIYGCAWLIKNDKLGVTLVIDNAQEIVNHIHWWSANNTSRMLQVLVGDDGRCYTVAIVPNLDESILRWNENNKIAGEVEIDDDTKFNAFFQPLAFKSGVSAGYSNVKSMISDSKTIMVGLMDRKDLGTLNTINEDLILYVGELEIARSDFWSAYVLSSLKDVIDPSELN